MMNEPNMANVATLFMLARVRVTFRNLEQCEMRLREDKDTPDRYDVQEHIDELQRQVDRAVWLAEQASQPASKLIDPEIVELARTDIAERLEKLRSWVAFWEEVKLTKPEGVRREVKKIKKTLTPEGRAHLEAAFDTMVAEGDKVSEAEEQTTSQYEKHGISSMDIETHVAYVAKIAETLQTFTSLAELSGMFEDDLAERIHEYATAKCAWIRSRHEFWNDLLKHRLS